MNVCMYLRTYDYVPLLPSATMIYSIICNMPLSRGPTGRPWSSSCFEPLRVSGQNVRVGLPFGIIHKTESLLRHLCLSFLFSYQEKQFLSLEVGLSLHFLSLEVGLSLLEVGLSLHFLSLEVGLSLRFLSLEVGLTYGINELFVVCHQPLHGI